MDALLSFLAAARPTSLMPIAALLLLAGGLAVVWPLLAGGEGRGDVKRRLKVETDAPIEKREPAPKKNFGGAAQEKAAKSAYEFYAKSDPENVARLRMKLIQAGYMEPRAVGTFFLIRFAAFAAGVIGALVLESGMGGGEAGTMSRWTFAIMAGGVGYFLPGFILSRMVKTKMIEYRNGFPDFMDLMIVCSDAGMSMEAGIERVSKELAVTYPSLVRDAASAIQGAWHQPVRCAARLLGRNAPQAHVVSRRKGACLAGKNVGAGDGVHPARGDDDRDHSDHREADRRVAGA
jgi:tight adherence protein C